MYPANIRSIRNALDQMESEHHFPIRQDKVVDEFHNEISKSMLSYRSLSNALITSGIEVESALAFEILPETAHAKLRNYFAAIERKWKHVHKHEFEFAADARSSQIDLRKEIEELLKPRVFDVKTEHIRSALARMGFSIES